MDGSLLPGSSFVHHMRARRLAVGIVTVVRSGEGDAREFIKRNRGGSLESTIRLTIRVGGIHT